MDFDQPFKIKKSISHNDDIDLTDDSIVLSNDNSSSSVTDDPQNPSSNINTTLDKQSQGLVQDLKIEQITDLPPIEMPDLDEEMIVPDLGLSENNNIDTNSQPVVPTIDQLSQSPNLPELPDIEDEDLLMAGNLSEDNKLPNLNIQNENKISSSISLGDPSSETNHEITSVDDQVKPILKSEEIHNDQILDHVEPIDFSKPNDLLEPANDQNKADLSWASLKDEKPSANDLNQKPVDTVSDIPVDVVNTKVSNAENLTQQLENKDENLPEGLQFATADEKSQSTSNNKPKKLNKHGFLKILLALGPLFLIGSLVFVYFSLKGGSGTQPEVFNSTDNCDNRGLWISDCETHDSPSTCSGWYTATCGGGGGGGEGGGGGQECSYEGCHSGRKWCGNDHKWYSGLDSNCNECTAGETKCEGTTKECANTGLWFDTGEACSTEIISSGSHLECWDNACMQVSNENGQSDNSDGCSNAGDSCSARVSLIEAGLSNNCTADQSVCVGNNRYQCNNDGYKWKNINDNWCDSDGNTYKCNDSKKTQIDDCDYRGCSGNNPPKCISDGGGTNAYACTTTPSVCEGDTDIQCASDAGSGCGWFNNACICNDGSNVPAGSIAACHGGSLCNEGETYFDVSVSSCSKDSDSKSQCRDDANVGVGCSSSTITLAPGECTQGSNSISCGVWQVDAQGAGQTCSATGCNWDDNSCSPPEITYSCQSLTADKTTAKVGDVIHFTLTGHTSGLLSNSTFNDAHYKINTGAWQNIADSTHPYDFNYTVSSADGDDISFTAEVAHGSPKVWESSTSCQKNISVTHDQLACLEIRSSINYQNIDRGSNVRFTCIPQGALADHADFRMRLNNAATNDGQNNVSFTNDSAVWDYHVDENAVEGTYLAQCRVCDDNNNCTQWGRSSAVTIN